jgi:hypothetical protein
VALGDGAAAHHGVDVGDLVVAEQIIPCGACRLCRQGDYQVCLRSFIFGFAPEAPGAMAEYMIYPEKAKVHKVCVRIIRVCRKVDNTIHINRFPQMSMRVTLHMLSPSLVAFTEWNEPTLSSETLLWCQVVGLWASPWLPESGSEVPNV